MTDLISLRNMCNSRGISCRNSRGGFLTRRQMIAKLAQHGGANNYELTFELDEDSDSSGMLTILTDGGDSETGVTISDKVDLANLLHQGDFEDGLVIGHSEGNDVTLQTIDGSLHLLCEEYEMDVDVGHGFINDLLNVLDQ